MPGKCCFVGAVKALYVMGGSAHKGNITPTAEFNFFCDPEAAHLVLKKVALFCSPMHVSLHTLHIGLYKTWVHVLRLCLSCIDAVEQFTCQHPVTCAGYVMCAI